MPDGISLSPFPQVGHFAYFSTVALSKGGGTVKITPARGVSPGNKTKYATRHDLVRRTKGAGCVFAVKRNLWRRIFCALSWILLFASPSASGAAAGRSLAEQDQRALEIRLAISRLPEERVEERESLYYEIVKSCPETEAAEEALWTLSNLYLDSFPEPREQMAREVLELFLAHYPTSRWGVQVRNRLVLLYEGTENRSRVVELCRELLRAGAMDLPSSYRPFLALTEAEAWDQANETERAREAYAAVVRDYPETPQARSAGRRLAEIKAKGSGKK